YYIDRSVAHCDFLSLPTRRSSDLSDIQGNNTVGARSGVFFQGGLFDNPLFGYHDQIVVAHIILIIKILYLQDRPDLVITLNINQVLDRPSLGGFTSFRIFVCLQPKQFAFICKYQQVVLGGGTEEILCKVIRFSRYSSRSYPSPALGSVFS